MSNLLAPAQVIGLSETELARRMGVTIETVSRWEKGKKGMRLLAERFLRLLGALELQMECPTLECLGIAPADGLSVSLVWTREDWVAVA